MNSGSVVFDRYRLEERLGGGGMGVVWRASDLLLDQSVALKRICLAAADDQYAELTRDRALREARLAARLRHHQHVVATYDVRVDDGDVWLVLEYLPSRSLAQILRERGPLGADRVARIGAQVADALAAAHALGIQHRDITPGNVLITDDGTAKLTDFGISHLAGDTQLTQTGVISGTFAYLAPEVARNGKSSPASDVFSLGSTLYAAVEGQPPFGTADNALQLLHVVGVGIIRPPTAAGALTPLLMRLLELDPATRLDAATARDKLDEFATQDNAPLHRPPPALEPSRRWLLRHRALIAVLALLTLGVLTAGITFALISGRGNLPEVAVPELPELPSTVGPITLTGEPKAADPCPLIDLRLLRQFGQPTITVNDLGECQARITTATDNFHLDVSFATSAESAASLGGTRHRLGDLVIVRKRNLSGNSWVGCENVLVLADRTRISIRTYAPPALSPDNCSVTEVATATAVNSLARRGISYRLSGSGGSLLAASNACAVLDGDALTKIPGLDPTIHNPGFADWSCTWGASSKGSPQVSLSFARHYGNRFSRGRYGLPTTIAGHRAWLHSAAGNNDSQQFTAWVVYGPAPSATTTTDMIEINVDAPASGPDLRAYATKLAAAAETKLPPT